MKKNKIKEKIRKIYHWIMKSKLRKIISLFLIVLFLGVLSFLFFSKKTQAAWFDENWFFRKSIDITNNTTQETNVYVSLTLDTSDTTKFQTDCGDLRFTKYNGELMPYYIVSGCGTNSTVVHVNFDTFSSGKQTIFEYYGNPMAPNGFSASDFSTPATSYTVGSLGTEEKSPAPVAYWTFDEGQGATAHDESVNRNDGTLGIGTSAPAWKPESECVSGKCLSFDGSNDYVNAQNANISSGNFTYSVWAKPGVVANANSRIIGQGTSADGSIIFLGISQTNKYTVTVNSNSAFYTTTCDANINNWDHIAFSYTSNLISVYVNGRACFSQAQAVNYSNDGYLEIGRSRSGTATTYFNGFIDEPKIYPYARTPQQILQDYAAGQAGMGKAKTGVSAAFGDRSDKWMTDGLVGYWKMDESTGTAVQDYSGNNNNGTSTNMLEAGTAAISSDTLNIIPASTAPFSATDDSYNNMIVYITGGTGCGITTGTERIISDYTGSTRTIIVGFAFSAETDNCTFEIKHRVGGKFGNAGAFDGVDDKVSVPSASNLNFGQNSYSVGMWMKSTQLTSQYSYFVSKEVSGWNSGYSFGHYLNGRLSASISGGSWGNSVSVITSNAYNDNTWHYVMLTVDSSSKRLKVFIDGTQTSIYINAPACGRLEGKDLNFSACTSITATAASNLAIGAPSWAHESVRSFLDEVRIYNRALSPNEVQKLYNFAPGPVARWKMDEKVSGDSKTLLDDSGNGNNGTTYYGTNATGMDCTKPGKFGTACEFDGADDRIIAGTSSSLDINYNLTLEAWVKPSTLTKAGGGEIISKDADAYFYRMAFNDGGAVSFRAFGTSDATLASSSVLAVNSWNHIAMVYDGATKKIFINGKPDASEATTGIMSYAAGRIFYIGGYGNSNENFPGAIDDVRVYNYARTQSQIIEDMQNGSRDPLAHWKFDEGYGSTVHNEGLASGPEGGTVLNGTLGTGSSAPTWSNDGKYGKALSFNGTGNYVSVTDSGALCGMSQLTLSAWFKIGTGGQTQQILSHYGPYHLALTWDNKLVFSTTAASGTVALTSDNAVSVGSWTHVIGTYDGAMMRLYVNGVKVKEVAQTGTIQFTSSYGVYVGNHYNANYFNGVIDEVKIYNFALTSDDVKNDYDHSASAQMGSSGSVPSGPEAGTPTNAASGEYCVPGDTTSCAPPIGEWKMDEKNAATAYDTSGNGKDGSLGTGSSVPTWISGKLGGGLRFDGVDDYVQTPTVSFTSAFSVSFWMKTTTTVINATPFSWNWYEYCLMNSSMGAPYQNKITCGDGTGGVVSNVIVNDGNWHYVEWTNTGSSQSLYVDGKFQGSDIGGPIGTGAAVILGTDAGKTRNFSGTIDQVRIYNYARTPAQVAWEYNKGKPVAEWKMNECSGGTIHDEAASGPAGNGNNGTINLGATGSQTTTLGNGTCITAGTTPWYNGRAGKYSGSLNFDGTDDYVSAASTGLVNAAAKSVFAWVYPTNDNNGWQRIVNHMPDASAQWLLAISYPDGTGTNFTAGGTPNNNGVYGVTNASFPINTWHHIGWTFDGAIWTVYVDGKSYPTNTVQGTWGFSGTTGLLIGARTLANYYYYGQIDDVKIFNYGLTGDQVKTLYNASSAVNFGN